MRSALNEAIRSGIEAHKAGDLQLADKFYTKALKLDPNNPDANHNMGILAFNLGKIETALKFLKIAKEQNPKVEQYWSSYIEALIHKNMITEAAEELVKAFGAGHSSQILMALKGKINAKRIDTKVETKPNDPPEKLIEKLVQFCKNGDHQTACLNTLKLLKKFPYSPILHNILGVSNYSLGKFKNAIDALKTAIKLRPEYAEAYNNMGLTYAAIKEINKAIYCYQKALKIRPDYTSAYNNLGNAYQLKNDFQTAISCYQTAVRLDPSFADGHHNLGNATKLSGDLDSAISHFNRAISTRPDFAQSYNMLGNAYFEKGEIADSKKYYLEALAINPGYATVHRQLTQLITYNEHEPHFEHLKKLVSDSTLSDDDQCHLNFAIAKAYEDMADYQHAFHHLQRGNALRKKQLKYDFSNDVKLFELLKQKQINFANFSLGKGTNATQVTPIFIVGMPRSGTTLVEQILSCHDEIQGGGELKHIEQICASLLKRPSENFHEQLEQARESYLTKISRLCSNEKYLTDKMPHNFRFLNFIFALFPEAKVLHVKRTPQATCWSNFRSYFQTSGLGYCYNLNDLTRYYNLYTELMNFWETVFPGKIISFDYDRLTKDKVTETKRLLSLLDIPWDKACLEPHRNKRSITTSSALQVKKKIYKNSSKSWLNFEPFLDGAFDNI